MSCCSEGTCDATGVCDEEEIGMALVKVKDVPQGEEFRYLDHTWSRGDTSDLWVEATPDDNSRGTVYQQLWYATEVEYTEPVPPPVKGELWSDGPVWGSRVGETVWFCTGENMTTGSPSVSVKTDTFRTIHRPSSVRLYPSAE
jgi:hypothetical protein